MRTGHIAYLIFLSLLCAWSCVRVEGPDDVDNQADIQFLAKDVETKGLIGNDEFHTNGTELKVVDLLSSFSGKIDGSTWTDGNAYIDETVVYAGSTIWNYKSGNPVYPWTNSGTHKFFGWMTYDKNSDLNATALFGSGQPARSGSTLSFPEVEMTVSSPQYDALYSDLVVRNAASDPHTTVPLQMSHLFSALAFTVKNNSENQIKIRSITMPNLPNKASASVDYSGSNAVLTQSAAVVGNNPFFTNQFPAEGLVLNNGDLKDVYTGETPSAVNYKLLWPVPASVLSPRTANPYANLTDESDPNYKYKNSLNNPADSLIRISYDIYVPASGGQPAKWLTRENVGVKLPSISFSAGKRSVLALTITDQVLDLTFVDQDWDFNEYAMDFSVTAVTVTQDLQFKNGTFDATMSDLGHKPPLVYTNSMEPVEATFKITSPVGARIIAEPLSASEYFDIHLDPDHVDPTNNGGTVQLTISPKGSPATTQTLTMKFHLLMGSGASEREVDLSSDLNRDNYNIIWKRN